MNKKQIYEKTIESIKKELNNPDQRIITLYQIVEKIPKNINELFEELRIITDTIFPTLAEETNISDYCKICLLEKKELKNISNTNKKIQTILELELSITLEEKEKKLVKRLAKNILELIEIKEELEKKIFELAEKNYKNFCSVASTKIACQMLVITGSFSRLSKMPSSTVQLLGAEKALFKSIRQRSKKTPKHGLLFNHPLVVNSENKGKISRIIAGKIVIAIKADISGIDIREELNRKILEKI